MPKRGQEQNFTDESAVTKPMSMNSIRWEVGSDSNIVLSKPESHGRAMKISTDVVQSFLQGTATELDTTDNVRHSQVKIQENMQSTETWKRDRVSYFFQR